MRARHRSRGRVARGHPRQPRRPGDRASTPPHVRPADDQRHPGRRLRAGPPARPDQPGPRLHERPRLALLGHELDLALRGRRQDVQVGHLGDSQGGQGQSVRGRRRHRARRRHGRQPLLQRPDARQLQHGTLARPRRDVRLQQHRGPGCRGRPPVVCDRRRPDHGHRARQRRRPQHLPRQRRDRAGQRRVPRLGSRQQRPRDVPFAAPRRRRGSGHPVRPRAARQRPAQLRRGDHGQRRGQPDRDDDGRARRLPGREARLRDPRRRDLEPDPDRPLLPGAVRDRSERAEVPRSPRGDARHDPRRRGLPDGEDRRQLPDDGDRQRGQPLRRLVAGAAGPEYLPDHRQHAAQVQLFDERGHDLVGAGHGPDARPPQQRLPVAGCGRQRTRRRRLVWNADARRSGQSRLRHRRGRPRRPRRDHEWHLEPLPRADAQRPRGVADLHHPDPGRRAPHPQGNDPDADRRPVRRPHAGRLPAASCRQHGRGADRLRGLEQRGRAVRAARDVREAERRLERLCGEPDRERRRDPDQRRERSVGRRQARERRRLRPEHARAGHPRLELLAAERERLPSRWDALLPREDDGQQPLAGAAGPGRRLRLADAVARPGGDGLHVERRLVPQRRQEPVRLLRVERDVLVGPERGAPRRRRRDADLSRRDADHGVGRLLLHARAARADHDRRPDRRRQPRRGRRAAQSEPALQRDREHDDAHRAGGDEPAVDPAVPALHRPDRRGPLRPDRRRPRL